MKLFFRRLAAACCALCLLATSALALSTDEARALLEERYIDELPPGVCDAQTLDELFRALGDPYTYYMDAAAYASFNADVEQEGSVTGIGAVIEYTADGMRIAAVLDGGGAQEAGLTRGDLIVAVDGTPCVPAGDQHRALVVGAEGTSVTLTVRHADGAVRDYRIVRRTVATHNTTVSFTDGVGYIDCNSFGSQTGTYFRDGVERHGDADHWIVDLRGNPGGLADAAVGALGAFTGFEARIYYRDRAGDLAFTVGLVDALTDRPVLVLLDENTASASELFAGGIRAAGAGVLIGTRTFGKGTAQVVLNAQNRPELFDGDALKLTAYRFYSGDGNTNDRLGVIPTLLLEGVSAEDAAALLHTERPAAEDYLRMTLCGTDYYVNLSEARAPRFANAFAQLLAALPPDAPLACLIDGLEVPRTPAETARLCRVDAPLRTFADTAESPYRRELDTLAVYRILRGGADGAFHPDETLTRAQLCALLAQALALPAAEGGYPDVADGQWYAGAVGAVSRLGLVRGAADGRFYPEETLTNEEFFTILGRLAAFLNFHVSDFAAGLDLEAIALDASFASYADWARGGVFTLYGFLTGDDGQPQSMLCDELDAIAPQAPVTRAQAAATLCRVLCGLGILAY